MKSTQIVSIMTMIVTAATWNIVPLAAFEILHDAPPDTTESGWNSNIGSQQMVQEFTLGSNSIVESIVWYGYFFSATPDRGTFKLQFFADVAGNPETNEFYLFETNILAGVDTGLDTSFGEDIYRWEVSVTPVGLNGGRQYWFGVKANNQLPPSWTWTHSFTDGSGTGFFRTNDNNPWNESPTGPNRGTQAFQLSGVASEPIVVVPDSFTVARGQYYSGGESDLAVSDNSDLSLRRLGTDIQSRTEFEVKSTSPIATPIRFEFTLEGAVFALAARSPAPDLVVTAAAPSELSRFVEAGTMYIEARVRYQSDNPREISRPTLIKQFGRSNEDKIVA